MVSLDKVEDQLKQIGFNFRAWGRGEIKELCRILTDDETIEQCANGYYEGGFAMLVATDQRLLLVDRKPMFLNMEAIWYDKIGQIDYYHRMINATICISSPNKDLTFTSLNHARLRQILAFSQQKMIAAKEGKTAEEGERRAEESMKRAAQPRETRLWGGKLADPVEIANKLGIGPTRTNNDKSSERPQASEQKTEKSINQPSINQPPIPFNASSEKLKLYTAARLPFSRRRYFVPREP